MSGYHERLIAEIHQHLDALAERGEPWVARWITHAVVQAHSDVLPAGEHGEFFEWAAYQTVRTQVRTVIGKRAGDKPHEPSEREQISLPGFDRQHLQDYYLVRRNGDDIGVPVTDLADDEIEAKAALYRSMGAACYAHADELDRFIHWRRAAA
jgi:hypothetical protein